MVLTYNVITHVTSIVSSVIEHKTNHNASSSTETEPPTTNTFEAIERDWMEPLGYNGGDDSDTE